LIESLEGKRAYPRIKPPFPAIYGLFGCPTIVQNVETLSCVPSILHNGPDWFKAIGPETGPGPKIYCVSGHVEKPGLYELPLGIPLREVIYEHAGGIRGGKKLKAVMPAGSSFPILTPDEIDVNMDFDSMRAIGAFLGTAGVIVMDEDTCMVDVAKFFMEFIQRESCGKCIPCREGTLRLLEILERITRGRRQESGTDALERFRGVMMLTELAEVIKDTSLCGLGQTAPNPVLSTLRWFRDEYEAHVYERRCPAGVCPELRTLEINDEKCTGCGLCRSKCPTEAISTSAPRRACAPSCATPG